MFTCFRRRGEIAIEASLVLTLVALLAIYLLLSHGYRQRALIANGAETPQPAKNLKIPPSAR